MSGRARKIDFWDTNLRPWNMFVQNGRRRNGREKRTGRINSKLSCARVVCVRQECVRTSRRKASERARGELPEALAWPLPAPFVDHAHVSSSHATLLRILLQCERPLRRRSTSEATATATASTITVQTRYARQTSFREHLS